MNDIAIEVENLSKLYKIGVRQQGYKTLRESIMGTLVAPFQRLKRLSQSTSSGQQSTVNGQPSDDTIWALKDVSFEVRRGEVVGIIGRNGAGKTTLLKILSRITEPTEGRAEIHGRVGSLLEVGTGFHPELTGLENIYLNGAILGMRKTEIEQKFDEIVSFAEIEKFIYTPVKRYSSGMYVRLAFAVAAHLEPEILLVDEVLAVGDIAFQKKCLGKMEGVAKEGRTVLFVSHNMFSLQNLCTRGILLESGQISMEGSITDVINKYLDLGREQTGEVCWASPDGAPGNERVHLKAVRVVSEEAATATVDISKEFRIEIDYWNIETNRRRFIAIGLNNPMGICVFTSSNLPSVSLTPDPWYSRPYPNGLFRTSCTVPGNFLNDGPHSISVFINGETVSDSIIAVKDIMSFTVQDMGAMRKEYTGKWVGAVRPRLAWQTDQLSNMESGL